MNGSICYDTRIDDTRIYVDGYRAYKITKLFYVLSNVLLDMWQILALSRVICATWNSIIFFVTNGMYGVASWDIFWFIRVLRRWAWNVERTGDVKNICRTVVGDLEGAGNGSFRKLRVRWEKSINGIHRNRTWETHWILSLRIIFSCGFLCSIEAVNLFSLWGITGFSKRSIFHGASMSGTLIDKETDSLCMYSLIKLRFKRVSTSCTVWWKEKWNFRLKANRLRQTKTFCEGRRLQVKLGQVRLVQSSARSVLVSQTTRGSFRFDILKIMVLRTLFSSWSSWGRYSFLCKVTPFTKCTFLQCSTQFSNTCNRPFVTSCLGWQR